MDEFKRYKDRVNAWKSTGRILVPKVKKYAIIKDEKPFALNMTYSEADSLKRYLIKRINRNEDKSTFDIVFTHEE